MDGNSIKMINQYRWLVKEEPDGNNFYLLAENKKGEFLRVADIWEDGSISFPFATLNIEKDILLIGLEELYETWKGKYE